MAVQNIQERTFQFACRIVRLCDFLKRRPGTTRLLSNQIIRSATSVGANLVEASAGQSRADFISKCSIAAKETRETHYWLRLLLATGSVDDSKLTPLVNEANEIVAILTTIVKNSQQRLVP